jgi:hypothetical protein
VTVHAVALKVVERDGQLVNVVAAVVGKLNFDARETLMGGATQNAPSERSLHVDKSRGPLTGNRVAALSHGRLAPWLWRRRFAERQSSFLFSASAAWAQRT